MQKPQGPIIPVLLGADLNCYTMARAFYEAYGAFSYAFGKTPLGATRGARFIRFRAVPSLGDGALCLQTLSDFAAQMRGKGRLFLVPCTDEYAYFLIDRQAQLRRDYLFSVPPRRFLSYFDKDIFYEACARYGIPFPETVVFSSSPTDSALAGALARLGLPVIVKPSSSRAYWKHPFSGMEKVYLAENAEQTRKILSDIFSSGYPSRVLLQKYLPGGDAAAATLTVYSDRTGHVRLRAYADVLLEEHTPCGKGNYAALLTAPVPPIADKICAFLEAEHYVGFANFDLRRGESGALFVLEMNLRQGRSSHFLTAGGQNPARWLVRDLTDMPLPQRDMDTPVLFRTVPRGVLRHYAPDPARLSVAERLFGTEGEATPCGGDFLRSYSLRRAAYLAFHAMRERQKFRRFATRMR